jgi:hypothetical protein
MAITQLQLYNGALRLLGERSIASLSEAREPRRVLDGIWSEGARDFCLSQGQWNFATRTMKLDYDPDITPAFGLRYAFGKPTDWVRTTAFCWDEYFQQPNLNYVDEGGFWFADCPEIYVKYISSDEAFGYDLSLWPANFSRFVQAYMAFEAAPRVASSAALQEEIRRTMAKRKTEALSTDAMDEPTRFPARSSWTIARGQGRRAETSRHTGNIY